MSEPLVSCILGTYNREDYLRDSLESIFNQTYPRTEVVVVDDASTDGTLDIVRSYKDKIRLIQRDINSRTCELPRYQGTGQAKGSYCAFLDSDDLWEPTKLEKQVEFLERHPDIPLCHTAFRVIDDNNQELGIRHDGTISPSDDCAKALIEHCFITISSVMVRPNVWLNALAEDEITDFGMDWDFFLTIARDHPIGFLPDVLGSYRRSPQSVGQHKWRRVPRNVVTMERILKKGLWKDVVSRTEMTDALVGAYRENAVHYMHQYEVSRCLHFCLGALKHRPWTGSFFGIGLKAIAKAIFPRPA